MNTPVASRLWRSSRAVLAVATTCVLLGGCASSGGEESSSGISTNASQQDGLLPEAEGNVEYPLTIESAVGEITLDSRPERIAMASPFDADLFAALQIVPVGATSNIEVLHPWVIERIPGEIEHTWHIEGIEYPPEDVALSDPDLIVDLTTAREPSDVEQISDIAPVLGAPVSDGPPSWQENIRFFGEALDLENAAEEFIDEYDATFAQIREDNPEFEGLTIDQVGYQGSEWGAHFGNGTDTLTESLFSNLGFSPNPKADDFEAGGDFSDELVGTLEGDILLVINAAGEEDFEERYSNPLFQDLPSVRSGRVAVLSTEVIDSSMHMYHEGEPAGFEGHFGRSIGTPLGEIEIANMLVPILADLVPSEE